MSTTYRNHYQWLDDHLESFFKAAGLPDESHIGMDSAHGDKCYSYQTIWEEAGIHFYHGVAIFLLSYWSPYSKEVRQTDDGWVAPVDWVINNYARFKDMLESI